MTFTFDGEHAETYGLEEAIMIRHLSYWVALNKANERNERDGRYWTYNSIAAFERLFPFWTYAQMRRILASLVTQGVLVTANYNTARYDRTTWYAFVDEDAFLPKSVNTVKAEESAPAPEPVAQAEPKFTKDDWQFKLGAEAFDMLQRQGVLHPTVLRNGRTRDDVAFEWGEVFDKLHRLDNVRRKDIYAIIKWLDNPHNWWIESGNLGSFSDIRKRKDGKCKFDTLFAKWKKEGGGSTATADFSTRRTAGGGFR